MNNATRNEKLIAFHKADSLCRKLDKKSANGFHVDPTLIVQARKWRAEADAELRMIGWEGLDEQK